ncbi:hypothetical protein WJX84_000078 [Apatococcus fuscideae]|uniref:Uncharacterized protein n=1 Tax=Apatococcus fuscideae TaxID=2026836 RepID=A0AAW1SPS6_9CHLO
MVARAREPTVADLLNDCQKSPAAHSRSAKLLWELALQEPERCLEEVCSCLKHVLLIEEYQAQAERIIRFMGVFASQRTEGHEEDCDSFLDELLLQLLAAASVKDKAVRFRTCQILGSIMDNLHADADLSQEVAEKMEEAMLERLQDKVPGIRLQAARVLQRLAQPDEEDDPITAGLVQLLQQEKNKDIRRGVLSQLAVSQPSTQAMLARASDVSEEVEQNADIGDLVMTALLDNEIVTITADETLRLASPHAEALAPEAALYWGCACCWLHKRAQQMGHAAASGSGASARLDQAAASHSLEVLDSVLPETTESFVNYIRQHVDMGRDYTFAACQLLQIAATCLDLTDATGCQAVTELVSDLLRRPDIGQNQSLLLAATELARARYCREEKALKQLTARVESKPYQEIKGPPQP